MARIRPFVGTVKLDLPDGVQVDRDDLILLAAYNRWWVNKRGYAMTQSEFSVAGRRVRKSYLMHRVVMRAPKGSEVDHINRDPLDNRRVNLRLCSHAENGRNLSLKRNNTSGIVGVRFDKSRQRWVARLKLGYRDLYLGRFLTRDEAIEARKRGEAKHYGAFAPKGV